MRSKILWSFNLVLICAGSWACSEETSPDPCVGPLEPGVGGTAVARAHADAPARCGAPAYQWLRSAELGALGAHESVEVVDGGIVELAALLIDFPLSLKTVPDVSVHRFVYTTQDRGVLAEASAVVVVPHWEELPERTPMHLMLHGTTGFADACAPSRSSPYVTLAELLAVELGSVVVAPDYLGLKGLGDPSPELHPYLVGEVAAISSLDALRAARRLMERDYGDHCIDDTYSYFGASQGGHAALWVDRLAPYYAPELTAVGGVATVPPADLFAQFERAIAETVSASGNTLAFYGAASPWYGHGQAAETSFFAPRDPTIHEILASSCGDNELTGDISDATVEDVFAADMIAAARAGTFADVAPWGCMGLENSLTATSVARISEDAPTYGILFLLAEEDTLVHTPIERQAFTTLCEQGMPLQYLECQGASHEEATFWAMPEMLEFLRARHAGEAFVRPGSCAPQAAVTCLATP